jgi:DNA-directed RNA polymerase subunit RPC12/RpoP
MLRLRLRVVLLVVLPVLFLLGIAWLGRVTPGVPIVAILVGVLLFVAGVRLLRRAGSTPPAYQGPAEDVADLDVYFVCVECGTEFKVEKIGELQVPRHCGERMLVERRPRTARDLS